MTHLVNAFVTGLTTTENGANAVRGTGSALLDLFATAASWKGNDGQLKVLFDNAFSEDPNLAMKIVFWVRDIRGGQGKRDIFRKLMNFAQRRLSHAQSHNLARLVPEYGRWDDVFHIGNLEAAEVLVREQLMADSKAEHPSLLAKWMPSENTSSRATVALAKQLRKALGMTPRQYRKMLSDLRKRISLVEHRMTQNEWTGIKYEAVPSQAMLKYRKAFSRHDAEGFVRYLGDVKSGRKEIKASTLYPDQLVGKYTTRYRYANEMDEVVEAQWKALPDYFNGTSENAIVVADVSGSMHGHPLDVSISLALYCAERNKGAFHNKFITFSDSSEIQNVVGQTLAEKVSNLSRAKWEMTTNIESVFNNILRYAVQNRIAPSEMVSRVFIVSDMEFNAATRGHRRTETLFETFKRRYADAGYKLPSIVFWNVNARNVQFPITKDESSMQMVSGHSPSIIKDLLGNDFKTPMEQMLIVLNNERYAPVKV